MNSDMDEDDEEDDVDDVDDEELMYNPEYEGNSRSLYDY